MYDNSNKGFLQEHEGSFQFERLEGASLGAGMKVIDRTFEDLVKQTAEFAASVKFYNDEAKVDGNWKDFFVKVYDYKNKRVLTGVIDKMIETRSVDPHLALLFSFYQMLLKGQDDINTLTGRQLEFYYRDVLGFREKGSTEGKVTVFIELKKDAGTVTIPKGTLFDAGKDANGKRITYASTDEICMGHDEVGAISHFDNENGLIPVKDAGSGSGKGTGAGSGTDSGNDQDLAEHSFCVSASMLNQPGQDMTFYLDGADAKTRAALEGLRAEYTGGKGWESLEIVKHKADPLEWNISPDSEPIAPYDKAIHGGDQEFKDPVIRFVSDSGIAILSDINLKAIKGLRIKVKDATNIKVMNPSGEVDNRAGNNPFGPNYRINDTFWVDLPFPAEDAVMNCCFKDDLEVSEAFERNKVSRIVKCTYTLTDSRSDQIQLTNDYSRAVLMWMKGRSSQWSIDDAIKKGLMAVSPVLADSVRIATAEYYDTDLKTSLQYPYGSYETKGFENPADALRLLNGQTTCFFGLSGVSAAETDSENGSSSTDPQVSLYVKMADKAYLEPGKVKWSYLSGSSWLPFDSGSVLKDTTEGLSRSGVVMLSLKPGIFKKNEGMAEDFRWIRAVADNDNASKIADIIPGALELEYDAFSEGSGPQGKILPAGSITKLASDIPGIKTVSQPFDGLAGRLAETENTFNRRVSEQLRHKNRAWTAWDYEHIVLERFSEVAYVKCLPAHSIKNLSDPGTMTLIVVPESSPSDLKPAPNNVLRNDIADYVRLHCSPFVNVEVSGPVYKEIRVIVSVHLRDGYFDTGGYASKINEELKNYLKTWTGSTQEKGNFRSGAGKSEIIAFLESLPYVDYIDGINLNAGDASEDEDEILVSRPHELLTSAPSHDVKCYLAETHIV